MLYHRTMGIKKVSSLQRFQGKPSSKMMGKMALSSTTRSGSYPSLSSATKYGKLDAQLAQSAAKSYYDDSAPITNNPQNSSNTSNPLATRNASHSNTNYEGQLTHYIQRSQFNNAVHALHLMMQQRVKLQNVSLFPSILQCLKLCKKHHFHILELIEYIKFNSIALDSNTFAEILGICVAKNDEHSAKQIALLWVETMPHFPILPLIHCLSTQNTVNKPHFKYHKLGKQERIWQSIIDELTRILPSNPSDIVPISTPSSIALEQNAVDSVASSISNTDPSDFIRDQISRIQMNLTAKHHQLAVKHLDELHSFITRNPMDISSEELLPLFHRQNEAMSKTTNSNHIPKSQRNNNMWTQWLLREELMTSDFGAMESNDILRKLQDLGLREHTASALNALFLDLQKPWSHSNDAALSLSGNSEFARYQMLDHIHEVERRLPFILHFVSLNASNNTISQQTIQSVPWMNGLISLILEISTQTKTTSVSRKMVDRLFAFMHSHYVSALNLKGRETQNEMQNETGYQMKSGSNLMFHHQLFKQLKARIVAEHQRLKQQRNKSNRLRLSSSHHHHHNDSLDASPSTKYGAGYGTMRKLLQILNGFEGGDIIEMKKQHDVRHDLIPLMAPCAIESFYAKSKYVPTLLRSKDLSSAIIEAAFRFEHHELGHLLYYLFYHKTPPIIDSFAMTDFGVISSGLLSSSSSLKQSIHSPLPPPMVPLQIEWMDLRKIYSTLLGLSSNAINHLKDIDVLHLLHYAPLPVQDQREMDVDAGFSDLDTMRLGRGRQQRVLQVLAGICARSGSFDDVRKVLNYFEHDTVLTNNMRSFGMFFFNETLLHRFTNECVKFKNADLSEDSYIESVKEMTRDIYMKWKECITDILDDVQLDNRPRYQKYLLCLENLSSQIRNRQIVPLAQYLLYILDEFGIAPTRDIHSNLWFAFNVHDKFTPSTGGHTAFLPQNGDNGDSKESKEDENGYNIDDHEDEEGDMLRYKGTEFSPLSFARFERESNALTTTAAPIDFGGILDSKYKELQSKYITKEHIEYLLHQKREGEAILMLNQYSNEDHDTSTNQNGTFSSIDDSFKLKCIEEYILNKELRKSYYNHYPFLLSHWFPTAEPLVAHYHVQRRIDPQNDGGVIFAYDWTKRHDIHLDREKDITFYIPHDIMQRAQYKTVILRHCKEGLFHSENEKFGHLQLEILPFHPNADKAKMEANSMKNGYDLFIVRGCQSLDDKLEIWTEMIRLFESDLNVLCTVSSDHFQGDYMMNRSGSNQMDYQMTQFVQKLSNRYRCKIDANSISSFQFDQIPTFFIWKNVSSSDYGDDGRHEKDAMDGMMDNDNTNQLIQAKQALTEHLAQTASTRNEGTGYQRRPVLSIEISSKYYSALQIRFESKHAQIMRDLRYLRDTSRWKRVDANVTPKDVHDASKGGVLTITAPTRSLRRRVYQQILYSHPPSNDTTLRIRDQAVSETQSVEEWRTIDKMIYDLISSMEDADSLTISNALFISRLGEDSSILRGNAHREWMRSLFKTQQRMITDDDPQNETKEQKEDPLPFETPGEMLKICHLIFSALSMQQTRFGSICIAEIFQNMLMNPTILKMIDDHSSQQTISDMLYCAILSLCNHGLHSRRLSVTDFHRIRSAFLHCYCGKSENDGEGINQKLTQCLSVFNDSEAYMMCLLEWLYISCLLNHPNLATQIIRFVEEILTLMVAETNLDHDIYSQFASSALDLLLIDIAAPQRQCADTFVSIWRQSGDEMMMKMVDSTNPIFSEMDVETLKLILSELCPMEIESVAVPNRERERLYGSLLRGCSECGNIECIKLLLNRIDLEAKSHGDSVSLEQMDSLYTFGVDASCLDAICQSVWTYYDKVIGYDVEMSCHAVMQLLECMLSGHNKLWAVMVSEDMLTHFAIIMAENELMSAMQDLKELIESVESASKEGDGRFAQLMTVLTDVDFEMYIDDRSDLRRSDSYHHIK